MGERPAVAVDPAPAVGERDLASEGELGERGLGLGGERPSLEAGPAERQLGRLDTDQMTGGFPAFRSGSSSTPELRTNPLISP